MVSKLRGGQQIIWLISRGKGAAMNDEIERINQHYRYVELLASVLDAFTTKHEQVLVVHTIFFSLNHWPSEELFEEIP